jgi:hypothetical protein
MDKRVRLADVQQDFVNKKEQTWKCMFDSLEDPTILRGKGWISALNDSDQDNIERRCLEIMTE